MSRFNEIARQVKVGVMQMARVVDTSRTGFVLLVGHDTMMELIAEFHHRTSVHIVYGNAGTRRVYFMGYRVIVSADVPQDYVGVLASAREEMPSASAR